MTSPTPEESEAARALVAQHQEAARITGRTYAETLFNAVGGEQPPAEWFDERIRDFGRSFGEFYADRIKAGQVSQAFVKHMLGVGCEAMFTRLGELVDQPSAVKTGRAQH